MVEKIRLKLTKPVISAASLVLFCGALFGLNTGFTIYWVHSYSSHACQALDILTQHPVPQPSNPKANPSREVDWQFYQALVYWHNADGCT